MIAMFLDHHSPKSARRALLVSAFFTILLPTLQITGEGISVGGLLLVISLENILTASRFLTAYFLWIYAWFSFSYYFSSYKELSRIRYVKLVAKASQDANGIDNDISEREDEDPHQELDPWWAYHHELSNKQHRVAERLNFLDNVLKSLLNIVIEFLPALLIGTLAVFVPMWISEFLFNLSNSN